MLARRDGECRPDESGKIRKMGGKKERDVLANKFACQREKEGAGGGGRENPPITVVHLNVRAEQLALARLVGPIAPHLVAILLRLQQRRQVDARPHLLAPEFTVFHIFVFSNGGKKIYQHTSVGNNKRGKKRNKIKINP